MLIVELPLLPCTTETEVGDAEMLKLGVGEDPPDSAFICLLYTSVLESVPGKIVFRFHARDLHLVLGPTKNGKPIRFTVKLDGTAPGDDHGADTDAAGAGTVQGNRLYQLVRQKGAVEDRTFEIDFLDPGVQAFAFTFG